VCPVNFRGGSSVLYGLLLLQPLYALCPVLPGWADTRRNIYPLTYPDHPVGLTGVCFLQWGWPYIPMPTASKDWASIGLFQSWTLWLHLIWFIFECLCSLHKHRHDIVFVNQYLMLDFSVGRCILMELPLSLIQYCETVSENVLVLFFRNAETFSYGCTCNVNRQRNTTRRRSARLRRLRRRIKEPSKILICQKQKLRRYNFSW